MTSDKNAERALQKVIEQRKARANAITQQEAFDKLFTTEKTESKNEEKR